VWASGFGYLGHYDGAGVDWHQLGSAAGITLWGVGTGDVWLIQGSAWSTNPYIITHWKGLSGVTVAQDTQFTSARPLNAMWGNATSDLWAVGEAGAIIHYDGRAWSPISQSPTTVALRGVWGTAPNDVWAVGESGAMLHFDGSAWSTRVSPTSRTLWSVWGSLSAGVWAVGDSGTVLHRTP
jgi:hypothetical protein